MSKFLASLILKLFQDSLKVRSPNFLSTENKQHDGVGVKPGIESPTLSSQSSHIGFTSWPSTSNPFRRCTRRVRMRCRLRFPSFQTGFRGHNERSRCASDQARPREPGKIAPPTLDRMDPRSISMRDSISFTFISWQSPGVLTRHLVDLGIPRGPSSRRSAWDAIVSPGLQGLS
jgi:hypothetical protein